MNNILKEKIKELLQAGRLLSTESDCYLNNEGDAENLNDAIVKFDRIEQEIRETQKNNTTKITRLTIVDKDNGRLLEKWNTEIKVSIQDEGRTLKIFMEN